MLVFSGAFDLWDERHEAARKKAMAEIAEISGEKCVLLPSGIDFIGAVPVKNDAAQAGKAAPQD